jgi:diguanylate cyclase (GGDEF)-like protein
MKNVNLQDSDSAQENYLGQKGTILIMLTIIASFSVFVFYIILIQQARTEQEVKSLLQSEMQHKVYILEKEIENSRERMALLSSRTQMRILLLQHKNGQITDSESFEKRVKNIINDAQASSRSINSVYIFDTNKKLVSQAGLTNDVEAIRARLSALDTDKNTSMISLSDNDLDSYHDGILIVKNLYLKDEWVGIAAVEIDFHSLIHEIEGTTKVFRGQEFLYFFHWNKIGQLETVCSHQAARIEKYFPHLDENDLVKEDNHSSYELLDIYSESHLVLSHRLIELDAYMMLSVSKKQAFSGLYADINYTLIGVFIYIILVLTLGFIYGHKLSMDMQGFASLIEGLIDDPDGKLSGRFSGSYFSSMKRVINKLVSDRKSDIKSLEICQDEMRKTIEENEKRINGLMADIESLPMEDPITHIANKRLFLKEYDRAWKQGDKFQSQLSLMYIQIDYFDEFKDKLGNSGVDLCVTTINSILRKYINSDTDTLAQLKEGKYVLLYPACEKDLAMNIADRILKEVNDAKIYHPSSPISERVSVSIGGATVIPNKHLSNIEFSKSVEAALEESKRLGHNRFYFLDDQ